MPPAARSPPRFPASSRGPSRPRSRRPSSSRSQTGEHLVAEAGTGTGKSLAYLLPALASGRRVVVATATKALQEQLLAKDVPAAARALGREVTVAVLKGRQNYLCRRQLQSFGPMLLRDPRDEEAYEALQPWLAETETGDRAELPFEPSEALWAELAVGSDRCSGRRCPLLSTCFAEAARDRAAEAELVIANHALYFADVAAGGGVLPEHDAVVFDEAHRLEETAATWLGGRVSRAGLQPARARRRARLPRGRTSPFPARALDRVGAAGERLLRAVAPPAGRRRLREIPVEVALVLVDALAALAGALDGRAEGLDQLARRTLGARGAGRGVPRARRARAGRLGRSRTRSPGRRSRSRASCATGCGRTGPRRSSSRRR